MDSQLRATQQMQDVILMNTCSIRENAEQRVRNKLRQYQKQKRTNPSLIIGILGCMAERLKKELLEEEKLVDLGWLAQIRIAIFQI
jgi:tRNA-2-methylthio-N6-dimethylallyladenosine synthase